MKVAEHAFVKLHDYFGLQFLRRLQQFQVNKIKIEFFCIQKNIFFSQGEQLKRAEIAAFLKRDEEVEKIYIDMDRKYVNRERSPTQVMRMRESRFLAENDGCIANTRPTVYLIILFIGIQLTNYDVNQAIGFVLFKFFNQVLQQVMLCKMKHGMNQEIFIMIDNNGQFFYIFIFI